jgi:hypothetical protein
LPPVENPKNPKIGSPYSGSGIRKKFIPDPGGKKVPDPGSGYATLLRRKLIISTEHPISNPNTGIR